MRWVMSMGMSGGAYNEHIFSIYSAYIEHILKARGRNEERARKERGKNEERRICGGIPPKTEHRYASLSARGGVRGVTRRDSAAH